MNICVKKKNKKNKPALIIQKYYWQCRSFFPFKFFVV